MYFEDVLPLLMFAALAALLFTGYPVGFVLGGVGIGFGFIGIYFGIRQAGSAAVPPLLNSLSDPRRLSDQTTIRLVLAKLRDDALEPLFAQRGK